MLYPLAVNDNGCAECPPVAAMPVRAPKDLRDKVLSLQTEAQRAGLDALALILAMAAREANRVARWERRVAAELSAGPAPVQRPTDR
jgi:hypothetical protein